MALPTLVQLYESWRERRFAWGRTALVGLLTAALPFALFLTYCIGFGIIRNFRLQVNLMGHGWNELDFALLPLLFCTFFLLGPFVVPVLRNRRILDPRYFAFALYFVLFWAAFVLVKGPFWTRYYSNVLGPCAVLSIPFFAEHAAAPRARAPLYAFLIGVAVVEHALVYLHLVR
jgi:hypothetical protein